MALRYMLDTNTFSDLVKNPGGKVASTIAFVEDSKNAKVCISIIVAAEVRYGVAKKGSIKLTKQVDAILRVMEVLPLEPGVDEHYAQIRVGLERSGKTVSANDYFIAAHALATGAILVTKNRREFDRVEGLPVEDWLGN